MRNFDPEDYDERLGHLGRRRNVITSWIILAVLVLLLVDLGAIADRTADRSGEIICRPHTGSAKAPNSRPPQGDDWTRRLDPRDWDSETEDMDTIVDPATARPANARLNLRC